MADIESKKRSNLVTVGEIAGVFGIKGWVKVKSSTDPDSNILDYSPWWLKTRYGVKAVEVDESQHRPQGIVAHIVGVDDRDAATELRGVQIAIERDQLPDLEQGEYYWDQLIGLAVISHYDGGEHRLGCVANLLETGANDVLVIKADATSIDDRERLVPYLPDQVVQTVDIEQGMIVVKWDPDF